MSVFEDSSSGSVPVRHRAGAALVSCCIAVLLLAFAASAQEQAPAEPRPPDAPLESSSGAAEQTPESIDRPDAVEGEASESDADALGEGQFSVEDLEDLEEPIEPLPSADIEEIKITSERGMGTPTDAPISTVGFDADVILKEGIKDIRDLSNFTPSLEIKSAFAASNPTIFIRGVGLDDFNANAASAVAIYQDDVYMQSPAGQLFQFFDVEGVEVLRGPQGALYRNASAGAILVRSQKPTDEFDTYATVNVGNYRAVELLSAISGPIVPDFLSGRLSGIWGVRDGITKNRCAHPEVYTVECRPDPPDIGGKPIVTPGLPEHTNDIDAYALRAQLLFRPPVVDAEFLLNAHGGQNFSRAFQYQHRGVKFVQPRDLPADHDPDIEVPKPLYPPKRDANQYVDKDGDPFAGDYNIDGPEELGLWGISEKITWRFGDAYELESLTAYEWHDRFIFTNTDAHHNFVQEDPIEDTAWQLSEELNLRGEWTPTDLGDGSWIVGAYYLQEDLDVLNFFNVLHGVDLVQEYTQKMRNFAAYAQSDYKLQPGCAPVSCDFTLDLGARYNLEYKDFDIFVCGLDEAGGCKANLFAHEDALWDGLSGDISLRWHFRGTADNVYIKYSRGWKGGHFNGGAVTTFDVVTSVDPEIVDSYETGLRSLWFDDRLMLNLTGFYYDYQDLQVFLLEQTPNGFPIPKLENATDAVVYGFELDMGVSPIDGMNITYNFAWVESEYEEFIVGLLFKQEIETPRNAAPRPAFFVQKDLDYSGNPLIASPRFSMTGSVDYRIPLPWQLSGRGLGYVTPRLSFSWKDDVFFDAGRGTGALLNFPEATFGQKSFWVFNAALSWLSDDERIEVTGWVHNFMDEHYKTQSFDLHRGYGLLLDAFSDPRTYGATLSVSF
jgi:iron complex outermembrane receptor protein